MKVHLMGTLETGFGSQFYYSTPTGGVDSAATSSLGLGGLLYKKHKLDEMLFKDSCNSQLHNFTFYLVVIGRMEYS